MADVQGFTPLPELQRFSTKRAFAVFATESSDDYPENESVYAPIFCFSKLSRRGLTQRPVQIQVRDKYQGQ